MTELLTELKLNLEASRNINFIHSYLTFMEKKKTNIEVFALTPKKCKKELLNYLNNKALEDINKYRRKTTGVYIEP